jgi:dihydroorotate dehydrogenase
VIATLYRRLYPLLLSLMFRVPPERIHRIAARLIIAVGKYKMLRLPIARVLVTDDPVLRSRVFGVDFPAPLGLAAGFDKNAEAIDAWGALGFGFAEVGTVTGAAQPGNPAPRLFRLPADRALINRMGFNNHGAGAAANLLKQRKATTTMVPIGANIGKTKVVAAEDAVEDYLISARLLGPLADFLVVNVSSPNTPGLRDLQAVATLRPLLAAVQDAVEVPVLVKIAPDLADVDIDDIADLAVELGLAGIVCTNTTISRDGLSTPAGDVSAIGAGGLSGAPLADRSLEVLRQLHARVGDRLTLVSVGGIETADQAWERICAGASLIQGYTGFIYGGPLWATSIHRGLAQRVRAAGYRSISEAVGSASSERR